MSLDVNLIIPAKSPCPHCGHQEKEQWVFDANITHNLAGMAREAGIYYECWRPDEIEITQASQLIEPLRAGIGLMKADPPRFEKHNNPNGWGLYKNFVPWLERYLAACEQYPEAHVSVSR